MVGVGFGPIVQVDAAFRERTAAYADPKPLRGAFEEAARRAIDAGADVIVPGEGPLDVVLASPGGSRVDDIPMIDSLGTALALCEVRPAAGISGESSGG
jgi:allantoin racemase